VDTVHQTLQDDKKFFLFSMATPRRVFLRSLTQHACGNMTNGLMPRLKRWRQNLRFSKKRVQAARIGVDFAVLEYYRRNTSDFPLSETQRVSLLLQRFEKSCRDAGAAYIDEMRLAVADYVRCLSGTNPKRGCAKPWPREQR
jgi:hypothetical protein